jgi:CRISPR type III-A-associated protein Csm2
MTETIERIINTDNPDLLVKEAKNLAKKLRAHDEATKTQVRRLFATIRQIEAKWKQDPDGAYRDLVLFGPRLAYQAHRHSQIAALTQVIQQGIPLVGKDTQRLKRLVQFFEATVAYLLAGANYYGGE